MRRAKKRKSVLSLISGATAAVFLAVDILSAAPALAQTAPPASEVSLKPAFRIELPQDKGSIDALAAGSGPALIHIQDAHGSAEAQFHAEEILNHLHERYGLDLVLLEGASSKLVPGQLDLFPENAGLNRAVLESLVSRALVKGPELFLAAHPGVAAYGIEDAELYRRNIEAFRTVIRRQEEARRFLETMDLQIERLTSPYLNRDLRALLSRMEDFEMKRIPLDDWLVYLREKGKEFLEIDAADPAWQIDWPMFARIFRLREIEGEIDMAAFSAERQAFLEAARGLPEDLYGQVEAYLNSPLTHDRLPYPGTGLLFEKMVGALPAGFDYAAYPHVSRFIGHLILQSELRADMLFAEMNRLAAMLTARLAETEEEKKITGLFRSHRLLKRLFALELNAAGFREVKESVRPSELVRAFSEIDAGGRVREASFEGMESIDALYDSAVEFYGLAQGRDEAMIRNAEKLIRETGAQRAAVITGGFHSGPFQDYFAARDFNYALVSPSITRIEGRGLYLEAILQAGAPAESTLMAGSFLEAFASRVDVADARFLARRVAESVVTGLGRMGMRVVSGEKIEAAPDTENTYLVTIRTKDLLGQAYQVRLEVETGVEVTTSVRNVVRPAEGGRAAVRSELRDLPDGLDDLRQEYVKAGNAMVENELSRRSDLQFNPGVINREKYKSPRLGRIFQKGSPLAPGAWNGFLERLPEENSGKLLEDVRALNREVEIFLRGLARPAGRLLPPGFVESETGHMEFALRVLIEEHFEGAESRAASEMERHLDEVRGRLLQEENLEPRDRAPVLARLGALTIVLSDLAEAMVLYPSSGRRARMRRAEKTLVLISGGLKGEEAVQAEQLILSMQSALTTMQELRSLRAAEDFLAGRSELRSLEWEVFEEYMEDYLAGALQKQKTRFFGESDRQAGARFNAVERENETIRELLETLYSYFPEWDPAQPLEFLQLLEYVLTNQPGSQLIRDRIAADGAAAGEWEKISEAVWYEVNGTVETWGLLHPETSYLESYQMKTRLMEIFGLLHESGLRRESLAALLFRMDVLLSGYRATQVVREWSPADTRHVYEISGRYVQVGLDVPFAHQARITMTNPRAAESGQAPYVTHVVDQTQLAAFLSDVRHVNNLLKRWPFNFIRTNLHVSHKKAAVVSLLSFGASLLFGPAAGAAGAGLEIFLMTASAVLWIGFFNIRNRTKDRLERFSIMIQESAGRWMPVQEVQPAADAGEAVPEIRSELRDPANDIEYDPQLPSRMAEIIRENIKDFVSDIEAEEFWREQVWDPRFWQGSLDEGSVRAAVYYLGRAEDLQELYSSDTYRQKLENLIFILEMEDLSPPSSRPELRAAEALDRAALQLYSAAAGGKETENAEEAWKLLERRLVTSPRYFRASLPPEILEDAWMPRISILAGTLVDYPEATKDLRAGILEIIEEEALPALREAGNPWAFALPAAEDWLAFQIMRFMRDEDFEKRTMNWLGVAGRRSLLLRMGSIGPHLRKANSPVTDETDVTTTAQVLGRAAPYLKEAFENARAGRLSEAEIGRLRAEAFAVVNGLVYPAMISQKIYFDEKGIERLLHQYVQQVFKNVTREASGISPDALEAVAGAVEFLESRGGPEKDALFFYLHDISDANVMDIVVHNARSSEKISYWDVVSGEARALPFIRSARPDDVPEDDRPLRRKLFEAIYEALKREVRSELRGKTPAAEENFAALVKRGAEIAKEIYLGVDLVYSAARRKSPLANGFRHTVVEPAGNLRSWFEVLAEPGIKKPETALKNVRTHWEQVVDLSARLSVPENRQEFLLTAMPNLAPEQMKPDSEAVGNLQGHWALGAFLYFGFWDEEVDAAFRTGVAQKVETRREEMDALIEKMERLIAARQETPRERSELRDGEKPVEEITAQLVSEEATAPQKENAAYAIEKRFKTLAPEQHPAVFDALLQAVAVSPDAPGDTWKVYRAVYNVLDSLYLKGSVQIQLRESEFRRHVLHLGVRGQAGSLTLQTEFRDGQWVIQFDDAAVQAASREELVRELRAHPLAGGAGIAVEEDISSPDGIRFQYVNAQGVTELDRTVALSGPEAARPLNRTLGLAMALAFADSPARFAARSEMRGSETPEPEPYDYSVPAAASQQGSRNEERQLNNSDAWIIHRVELDNVLNGHGTLLVAIDGFAYHKVRREEENEDFAITVDGIEHEVAGLIRDSFAFFFETAMNDRQQEKPGEAVELKEVFRESLVQMRSAMHQSFFEGRNDPASPFYNKNYRDEGAVVTGLYVPDQGKVADGFFLGDAPLIAFTSDSDDLLYETFSREHNVITNPEEVKRLQAQGILIRYVKDEQGNDVPAGVIIRPAGARKKPAHDNDQSIQVSRAFYVGPFYEDSVSSEPEFFSIPLDPAKGDVYFVMGSDSGFVPGHVDAAQRIQEIVQAVKQGVPIEQILGPQAVDDTTLMAWKVLTAGRSELREGTGEEAEAGPLKAEKEGPVTAVVIADDQRGNRLVFTTLFERYEGLVIETAENGDEAYEKVAALRAQGHNILLMTDGWMPKPDDGARLVEKLRNEGIEIPVLYISGTKRPDNLPANVVFVAKSGSLAYTAALRRHIGEVLPPRSEMRSPEEGAAAVRTSEDIDLKAVRLLLSLRGFRRINAREDYAAVLKRLEDAGLIEGPGLAPRYLEVLNALRYDTRQREVYRSFLRRGLEQNILTREEGAAEIQSVFKTGYAGAELAALALEHGLLGREESRLLFSRALDGFRKNWAWGEYARLLRVLLQHEVLSREEGAALIKGLVEGENRSSEMILYGAGDFLVLADEENLVGRDVLIDFFKGIIESKKENEDRRHVYAKALLTALEQGVLDASEVRKAIDDELAALAEEDNQDQYESVLEAAIPANIFNRADKIRYVETLKQWGNSVFVSGSRLPGILLNEELLTGEDVRLMLSGFASRQWYAAFLEVLELALEQNLLSEEDRKTIMKEALRFSPHKEPLSNFDTVFTFAAEHGLPDKEHLREIVTSFPGQPYYEPFLYAGMLILAVQHGILTAEEARPLFLQVRSEENLSFSTLLKAYGQGMLERSELEQDTGKSGLEHAPVLLQEGLLSPEEIDQMAFSAVERVPYARYHLWSPDFRRAVMDRMLPEESFRDIAPLLEDAAGKNVPAAYYLMLRYLGREAGLSTEETGRLMQEGAGYFEKIRAAHEAAREHQRLNVPDFLSFDSAGLAVVQIVSEKLASQAVSNAIDRGYLPLLQEQLRLASQIEGPFVMILREFFESGRGRAVISSPDYFFQWMGFAASFKSLNIGPEVFRAALDEAENEEDVSNRLGIRVLRSIAEELGLEVDESRLDAASLQDWDLRYFGILVSAMGTWEARDKSLFRLIIKYTLENRFRALFDPAHFREIDLKKFYGEDEEYGWIQDIRQHNRRLLKAAKRYGIKTEYLLHPETFPQRTMAVQDKPLRPVDVLRQLHAAHRNYREWEAGQEEADRFTRNLPPNWQSFFKSGEEKIAARTKMLQDIASLAPLKAHLEAVTGRRPGELLEPAVDLLLALDAAERLQRGETIARESGNLTLGLWKRAAGRDMFAGNCAGSCTALGPNAAVVFEFLVDLGTQYLFVKDGKGDTIGYARFFFYRNRKKEPGIFVDSIDGRMDAYHDAILEYLRDYARAAGIKRENVSDRKEGVVRRKIGDALTDRYFHHSDIGIPASNARSELRGDEESGEIISLYGYEQEDRLDEELLRVYQEIEEDMRAGGFDVPPEFEDGNMFLAELDRLQEWSFAVTNEAGDVAGFVLNDPDSSAGPRYLEVELLGVEPDEQGNGYGSMLLDASENLARDLGKLGLWLEVEADNAPAILLYERFGFKAMRSRTERSYVVMRKDFDGRRSRQPFAVRSELRGRLEEFLERHAEPLRKNPDGTTYLATPPAVLVRVFEEIEKRTGPLAGKNYLAMGAGTLSDSLAAAVLRGMRVTAVEKDSHVSQIARETLDDAVRENLVASDAVALLGETDGFEISWTDADVVYFFYTQPGLAADDYGKTRREMEEKISRKIREMKPGSLIAFLFTGGQRMAGQHEFESLERLPHEVIKVSDTPATGLYLHLYRIPGFRSELRDISAAETVEGFLLSHVETSRQNADGTLYVPTPPAILPRILNEIEQTIGPLSGKRYFALGAGTLTDSIAAAALKGMKVTAVERDSRLSEKAARVLKDAIEQGIVGENDIDLRGSADAFDLSWAEADVVYFFYTQAVRTPEEREPARREFEEKLAAKVAEMKPGAVLAFLFTGAQMMAEQDEYETLKKLDLEIVPVDDRMTGLYLHLYRTGKERSELRTAVELSITGQNSFIIDAGPEERARLQADRQRLDETYPDFLPWTPARANAEVQYVMRRAAAQLRLLMPKGVSGNGFSAVRVFVEDLMQHPSDLDFLEEILRRTLESPEEVFDAIDDLDEDFDISTEDRAAVKRYYAGMNALPSISTEGLYTILETARHLTLRLILKTAAREPEISAGVMEILRRADDRIAEITQWDLLHRFPGASGFRLIHGVTGEDRPDISSGERGGFLPVENYYSHIAEHAMSFADPWVVVSDVPVESIRRVSWNFYSSRRSTYEPEAVVAGPVGRMRAFDLRNPKDLRDWMLFHNDYRRETERLGRIGLFDAREQGTVQAVNLEGMYANYFYMHAYNRVLAEGQPRVRDRFADLPDALILERELRDAIRRVFAGTGNPVLGLDYSEALLEQILRIETPYETEQRLRMAFRSELRGEEKIENLSSYTYDETLGRDESVAVAVKNQSQQAFTLGQVMGAASGVMGGAEVRRYRTGLVMGFDLAHDEMNKENADWIVEDREPTGIALSGDRMAVGSGDHVKLYDFRNRTIREYAYPWFASLHSVEFSPDGERLLAASTGFDAIFEFEISTGAMTWEWRAWENGFDQTPYGKKIVLEPSETRAQEEILSQEIMRFADPFIWKNKDGQVYGLPASYRAEHLNSARYLDENTFLVTLFHSGKAVVIDRKSGRITKTLENFKSPHGFMPVEDGFMLTDTQNGRLLLMDENLDLRGGLSVAGMPGVARIAKAPEWLQNVVRLPGGLWTMIDIHRRRLWIVDRENRRYRGIELPVDWAVQEVVPLSRAEAPDKGEGFDGYARSRVEIARAVLARTDGKKPVSKPVPPILRSELRDAEEETLDRRMQADLILRTLGYAGIAGLEQRLAKTAPEDLAAELARRTLKLPEAAQLSVHRFAFMPEDGQARPAAFDLRRTRSLLGVHPDRALGQLLAYGLAQASRRRHLGQWLGGAMNLVSGNPLVSIAARAASSQINAVSQNPNVLQAEEKRGADWIRMIGHITGLESELDRRMREVESKMPVRFGLFTIKGRGWSEWIGVLDASRHVVDGRHYWNPENDWSAIYHLPQRWFFSHWKEMIRPFMPQLAEMVRQAEEETARKIRTGHPEWTEFYRTHHAEFPDNTVAYWQDFFMTREVVASIRPFVFRIAEPYIREAIIQYRSLQLLPDEDFELLRKNWHIEDGRPWDEMQYSNPRKWKGKVRERLRSENNELKRQIELLKRRIEDFRQGRGIDGISPDASRLAIDEAELEELEKKQRESVNLLRMILQEPLRAVWDGGGTAPSGAGQPLIIRSELRQIEDPALESLTGVGKIEASAGVFPYTIPSAFEESEPLESNLDLSVRFARYGAAHAIRRNAEALKQKGAASMLNIGGGAGIDAMTVVYQTLQVHGVPAIDLELIELHEDAVRDMARNLRNQLSELGVPFKYSEEENIFDLGERGRIRLRRVEPGREFDHLIAEGKKFDLVFFNAPNVVRDSLRPDEKTLLEMTEAGFGEILNSLPGLLSPEGEAVIETSPLGHAAAVDFSRRNGMETEPAELLDPSDLARVLMSLKLDRSELRGVKAVEFSLPAEVKIIQESFPVMSFEEFHLLPDELTALYSDHVSTASHRLVINGKRYSIGKGKFLRFRFPNGDEATLYDHHNLFYGIVSEFLQRRGEDGGPRVYVHYDAHPDDAEFMKEGVDGRHKLTLLAILRDFIRGKGWFAASQIFYIANFMEGLERGALRRSDWRRIWVKHGKNEHDVSYMYSQVEDFRRFRGAPRAVAGLDLDMIVRGSGGVKAPEAWRFYQRDKKRLLEQLPDYRLLSFFISDPRYIDSPAALRIFADLFPLVAAEKLVRKDNARADRGRSELRGGGEMLSKGQIEKVIQTLAIQGLEVGGLRGDFAVSPASEEPDRDVLSKLGRVESALQERHQRLYRFRIVDNRRFGDRDDVRLEINLRKRSELRRNIDIIENPPEPLVNAEPDFAKVEEWVKAHPGAPMQETARFLAFLMKEYPEDVYLSFERLMAQLAIQVKIFNGRIRSDYVVYFDDDKGRPSSEPWVYGLALKAGLRPAVYAAYGRADLQYFLKYHPKIRNVLLVDDVIYSGEHMAGSVRSIEDVSAGRSPRPVIHVMVPFVRTPRPLGIAGLLKEKNMRIYPYLQVKSLDGMQAELMELARQGKAKDGYTVKKLERIFNKLKKAYTVDQSSNMFAYTQWSFPDAMSSLATDNFDEGETASVFEGYIVNINGRPVDDGQGNWLQVRFTPPVIKPYNPSSRALEELRNDPYWSGRLRSEQREVIVDGERYRYFDDGGQGVIFRRRANGKAVKVLLDPYAEREHVERFVQIVDGLIENGIPAVKYEIVTLEGPGEMAGKTALRYSFVEGDPLASSQFAEADAILDRIDELTGGLSDRHGDGIDQIEDYANFVSVDGKPFNFDPVNFVMLMERMEAEKGPPDTRTWKFDLEPFEAAMRNDTVAITPLLSNTRYLRGFYDGVAYFNIRVSMPGSSSIGVIKIHFLPTTPDEKKHQSILSLIRYFQEQLSSGAAIDQAITAAMVMAAEIEEEVRREEGPRSELRSEGAGLPETRQDEVTVIREFTGGIILLVWLEAGSEFIETLNRSGVLGFRIETDPRSAFQRAAGVQAEDRVRADIGGYLEHLKTYFGGKSRDELGTVADAFWLKELALENPDPDALFGLLQVFDAAAQAVRSEDPLLAVVSEDAETLKTAVYRTLNNRNFLKAAAGREEEARALLGRFDAGRIVSFIDAGENAEDALTGFAAHHKGTVTVLSEALAVRHSALVLLDRGTVKRDRGAVALAYGELLKATGLLAGMEEAAAGDLSRFTAEFIRQADFLALQAFEQGGLTYLKITSLEDLILKMQAGRLIEIMA